MIARSQTYTKSQVMNPIFQGVCNHFLTTRSWFWWGDKRKESVSLPYVTSCTAMRIGPGGKAQPLHRDDYINHNYHTEISEWDDERDARRETAVGLMVAGSRVTKENGGTQLIPRSHLWYVRLLLLLLLLFFGGLPTRTTIQELIEVDADPMVCRGTDRSTPPDVKDCIFADMEKGDGLIMLSSVFHGGGNNVTLDEHRLMFSTFVVRGHLRQEENQFLAVPKDVVKQYDRPTQRFIGYSISDPACGYVEEVDPIYTLYPDELKNVKPTDF